MTNSPARSPEARGGDPDRRRAAGGQRGRARAKGQPRDRQRARSNDRSRHEPRGGRPTHVDPARRAAQDLLAAVRERGAYANLALPAILTERRLHGRDAALATELAYGSCRTLGQLDAVLAACGDRPLEDLDGPVHDALRIGAYQLLHTRIPQHAAVSTAVELVRGGARPQASGYVNAVLRRVSERTLDEWVEVLAPAATADAWARLALATAHPRWIVAALADVLGVGIGAPTDGLEYAELRAALDADRAPAGVHLVARPGRIGQAELAAECAGQPGRFSPYAVYLPGGDPSRVSSVADGAAAVQDEGSQLVARALTLVELDGSDGTWLDLAAGPGGKAALLGALAAQRAGTVDAVEKAAHRARLVRTATQGLPVTVHTVDGRHPGLRPESFDRVLLDAPCTGLGALRRRPEARWRRTEGDVAPLVTVQRELLASAARLVRPGGVVAYVTCSPHLPETAGVIARRPSNLHLIDARAYFPGVPDLGNGPTVQLWPHRHGTDGMFCALMRAA